MQTFQIRSIILTILVLSPLTACSVVHDSIAQQRTETANVGVNSPCQSKGATTTRAVVKVLRANLRDKPSRSGKVVTELEKDEALALIRSAPIGPWYQVKESKTGSQGWVHGDVIALVSPNTPSTPSDARREQSQRPGPQTSGRSYINVDGQRISSPVFTDKRPAGASARCGDGSYSFSQHRQGTCSHHGGVAEWF
jgi:hypothetical protein